MRKIQILGTGCPKCKKLAEVAEAAARELGLEFEMEKITDIAQIVDFGIMATPGLAVDGKVHNSAAVFFEGRIAGCYHKMLLPNYGVFDEKRVFAPGIKPLVIEVGPARIGVVS